METALTTKANDVVVYDPSSEGRFETWRANRAIDQATTLEETVTIGAKLAAFARLLRRHKGLVADQNAVAICYLRSLRKAGEQLRAMGLQPGNPQWSNDSTNGHGKPTLKKLRLTKDDSSKYQRLASIPLQLFNRHAQKLMDEKTLITLASFLRLERSLHEDDPAPRSNPVADGLRRWRRDVESWKAKGLLADEDTHDEFTATLRAFLAEIACWPL
jgi:hypothetical protein